MHSDLFDATNLENESGQRFALQNNQLLRVSLGPDVLAIKGAMVAYQGQVEFIHEKAGSVGRLLKKMVTSEDMPLMRVQGQGEVFFASEAGYVYLLELAGDGISVNGRNLLAFDATLQWDINRVKGAGMMAGGLFNTTVQGQGTVALCTVGKPVVLDCAHPADVRRRPGRRRLVGQPGPSGGQLDEVLLGHPRRLGRGVPVRLPRPRLRRRAAQRVGAADERHRRRWRGRHRQPAQRVTRAARTARTVRSGRLGV